MRSAEGVEAHTVESSTLAFDAASSSCEIGQPMQML
jgi:hypothetical protein